MASHVATDLLIQNLFFYPETGSSLCEKLNDCYQQFSDSLQGKFFTRQSIIKQTIFIAVSDNPEYFQSKQKLLLCAKDFFGELPPTSILAQSPENNSLAVEFTYIEGIQSDELSRKQNDESSWLVIDRDKTKIVIVAGLGSSNEHENILLQSEAAFRQLHQILIEEKMEFSDIVRQWNYIEQITGTTDENNSPSQHYQIFNDVRTKYYQFSKFLNGFPAATGIGTDFGGISIDFIAAKPEDEKSIVAVKSPVQHDAYKYSQEVLAENNSMCDFCRTTPKFERAKILITEARKWIFISGTAAISGQASADTPSVEHQTEMTIRNILSLISSENLAKHEIISSEEAIPESLRVYVKYKNVSSSGV